MLPLTPNAGARRGRPLPSGPRRGRHPKPPARLLQASRQGAAGRAPTGGYCPRCPDLDDVDCGLGRGGGAPPGFDFAGADGSAAPASFGRED
jgi:hypothetical protein